MGNIAHILFEKKIEENDLVDALHEINNRRFGKFFNIKVDNKWSIVEFRCEKHPGLYWDFQLSDDGRKIHGKHPLGGYDWCHFCWTIFKHELATKWNGLLGDEADDEMLKPQLKEYSSFQKYLTKDKHGMYRKGEEHLKQKSIEFQTTNTPQELLVLLK